MKFSILIANYNNGQFLAQAVESVINQTYTNWEIVIVDDKSTDSSEKVYQKYNNDKRIRIFKNSQNKGCGFTKRKCVSLATGDISGFLDPDDTLALDAVKIMVEKHIEKPDHSIIYSTHYICTDEMEPLRISEHIGQIPLGESQLTWDGPRISAFASFKMSLYNKTEGISATSFKAIDQDLYYKLEETGPVLYIDKPLYFYRHHPGSISLNNNKFAAYISRMEISYRAYKRRSAGTLYPVKNLGRYEVARRMVKYHCYRAFEFNNKNEYRKMYLQLFRALKFAYADQNLTIIRAALIPVKKIVLNRSVR